MAQRSFKLPDELDAWLVEEAERRGKPWTPSSVIVSALERESQGAELTRATRQPVDRADAFRQATRKPKGKR
jgi:hypothetical protein